VKQPLCAPQFRRIALCHLLLRGHLFACRKQSIRRQPGGQESVLFQTKSCLDYPIYVSLTQRRDSQYEASSQ
jgi:hypothetical protein